MSIISQLKGKIEYHFFDEIIHIVNKYKNTKIQKKILDHEVKFINSIEKKLYRFCKNYNYLSNKSYNRFMEIDEINNYTVLQFSIDQTKSLKQMAKECLKNILNSQKILLNKKSITLKDCIIVDVLETSLLKFSTFHTDAEYSNFTGNGFNVWYLMENNENYGNMFLLETDEYKKEYTPCCLKDEYKGNLIPVTSNRYLKLPSFIKNTNTLGYINQNNIKVTYTNIKNCECLVMSKHVLHRTDLARKENVKGFNFRVIVKNKDGSVDYKNKYKNLDMFSNHIWDKKNKKLHGVELLDFA